MAAMEPLCILIGLDPKKFTKEENQLLEAELFRKICDELKGIMRQEYKQYFEMMKFNKDQEDTMLEETFLQNILNHIISSGKYTAHGIAFYTDMHVDVIDELTSGRNTKPTALCFRKIMEVDREVRTELYQAIGKKIAVELKN
ncbi:MAG: hypothetical protein JO149_04035 [Gammaproteobacteria bacterium]|nr:hypothetical protein [Gammaproteobacteria bacterium]